VDNKRAWGTNIKKQPAVNRHHAKGRWKPTEVAVERVTWKLLINNMYLEGTTRNLKGDDDAYKHAYCNALGGILVHALPFDSEKRAFTRDPCFMAIALPSTGLNGPTITLASDEVWVDDTCVHFSGLPVTAMGEDPLSPVCSMVGSKCLSSFGLVLVIMILRTDSVINWFVCINKNNNFKAI
jgi:hypothetical protein